MQPFGRNRYGPKIGGLYPFRGGGARSPPNTMWSGPRPTCVPSFILIRPTVWPQCTNVTDRTGQTTDRQHRANRFIAQTWYPHRIIHILSKECNRKQKLLILDDKSVGISYEVIIVVADAGGIYLQLKHVFTGKFVHISTTQTSRRDKNNMLVYTSTLL